MVAVEDAPVPFPPQNPPDSLKLELWNRVAEVEDAAVAITSCSSHESDEDVAGAVDRGSKGVVEVGK